MKKINILVDVTDVSGKLKSLLWKHAQQQSSLWRLGTLKFQTSTGTMGNSYRISARAGNTRWCQNSDYEGIQLLNCNDMLTGYT